MIHVDSSGRSQRDTKKPVGDRIEDPDRVQRSEETEVRMSPHQRREAEVETVVYGKVECREGRMVKLTGLGDLEDCWP